MSQLTLVKAEAVKPPKLPPIPKPALAAMGGTKCLWRGAVSGQRTLALVHTQHVKGMRILKNDVGLVLASAPDVPPDSATSPPAGTRSGTAADPISSTRTYWDCSLTTVATFWRPRLVCRPSKASTCSPLFFTSSVKDTSPPSPSPSAASGAGVATTSTLRSLPAAPASMARTR